MAIHCKSARKPHVHRKEETHNLSKVSRFLFKSFYFRRLQKQYCFSPIQILIFLILHNSADGHISSLGYLCGSWVKMSRAQENVFFSLFNCSCLDAIGLKGRQFSFRKQLFLAAAISNWWLGLDCCWKCVLCNTAFKKATEKANEEK